KNLLWWKCLSRESPQKRKIDLLRQTLQSADQLLIAELSRAGRNMLQTLNLIEPLSPCGVKLVFVRSYYSFKYFIEHDAELPHLRTSSRESPGE
ncbi:MAG: recombinase family protein, partial [Proteobacteria bacterium]|nr:recombinase family protein [Pseudomonadota bacterium]